MTSPAAGHSDSTSSEPSAQASGHSASAQTAAGTETTAFRQLRLALALLLAIIALATIWLPAWVPGTDMPTHLMMVELLAHPDRATDLVVRHYPATSQLSVWLTVPFALVFPLAVAGKAALTLFYAAYVAANARLGTRFGAWFPDTLTWSSAIFFGFCYAMGFTNFLVAAASGAMFLAAVCDHVQGRGRRTGLFILFWSLLCMHAHIIVFGMFGLQALVLVLLLPRPLNSGIVSAKPKGHFRAVVQLALYSLPALAATLVSLRDGYAALFVDLIADLPLPARTARRTLRLLLLGALNWTPNWYRPGGRRTPRRLAREFVQLLKAPLSQPSAHASSSAHS